MRQSLMKTRSLSGTVAISIIFSAMMLMGSSATVLAAEASALDEGKKVAFDRRKGNCLACHEIAGGDLPGNIGPALADMKGRFPDKAVLREQIWDATKANPNTIMPPFGKHQILTEQEIDLVVEFIHSL